MTTPIDPLVFHWLVIPGMVWVLFCRLARFWHLFYSIDDIQQSHAILLYTNTELNSLKIEYTNIIYIHIHI